MTPDETIAWLENIEKIAPTKTPCREIREWITGETTAGLSFASTEELFIEMARRMENSVFLAHDKTGTMIRLSSGPPVTLYGLSALAASSYMNDVELWTRNRKP